jgi:hypothetical protein
MVDFDPARGELTFAAQPTPAEQPVGAVGR